MTYWDTACVVKLYTPEPDSGKWLAVAAATPEPLYCSELLKTEFYFALRRKEQVREIKPGSAESLYRKFLDDARRNRLLFIPTGFDIEAKAREIGRICYTARKPIPLRTLDALHLATAVTAKIRRIATTDARMIDAAHLLSLDVVP